MSSFTYLHDGDELPRTHVPEPSLFVWQRGGASRWQSVTQACCGLLLVLGTGVAVCSSTMFTGGTRQQGLLVGLATCALAAAGAYGNARNRKRPLALRVLFAVGVLFAAMLTVQFITQAGRDVAVHCALAEAGARIHHLEERMTALKHDDMMLQLFVRVNEVDDMLDHVQQAATGHVEVRHQQFQLVHQDKEFIRSKVRKLKQHAEEVARGLRSQAESVKSNSTSEYGMSMAQVEAQERRRLDEVYMLERRAEAVLAVVQYIADKDGTQGDFKYQEYEMILQALMEGGVHNDALEGEAAGLPALQAAFERHEQQQQQPTALSGAVPKGMQVMRDRREKARRTFEERFLNVLSQHSPLGPNRFQQSLVEALEALPEHCLQDIRGFGVARLLGWASVAAQGLAAYCALTAMAYSAKKDF